MMEKVANGNLLVLTRNIGKRIIIGDDISVTVLSITGNQVKLGISAPKDVPVHREEIYNKIQNENDCTQP